MNKLIMNDWRKLLEYELIVHAKTTLESAKHRIETYLKEGNLLDETIPADIIAKKVKIWYDEWTKEEEAKKIKAKNLISKRRKKRWDKIFDDLLINAPSEKYPDLSLEYQLGHYIGDYIVERYLPTLSVDGSTNEIIEVTKEEAEEYEKLEEIWWNALHPNSNWNQKSDAKKEWNHRTAFKNMLKQKYMPKTLECHIPRITSVSEEKMEELKKGISSALLNSDVSYYSCDISDIGIIIDDNFFSVVNLKLAND
jgi:hypothetical protein